MVSRDDGALLKGDHRSIAAGSHVLLCIAMANCPVVVVAL
mgnify:CR=1 FL=1